MSTSNHSKELAELERKLRVVQEALKSIERQIRDLLKKVKQG